ncbi:MAG: hypothetical protein M1824_005276 [Vezdaea acicularis]|nr:MAG: hypothetical protein M1824_005276 [Vezdaea acicularis]
MAFRQPQHPIQQLQPAPAPITAHVPQTEQFVDDNQGWVLFSNQTESSIPRIQNNPTERTLRTAGLSQFSDLCSLDTVARSQDGDDADDLLESPFSTSNGAFIDEEGELDSLDSHLHAFREPLNYQRLLGLDQSGGTVLPTHDGLGTFPLSTPPFQDQSYEFERFNQRRRRRSNGYIAKMEIPKETDMNRRVQEWRMEQGQVLQQEIEKETRKRRMSKTSERFDRKVKAHKDDNTITGMNESRPLQPALGGKRHREINDADEQDNEPEDTECLWQRITRHVIRDLMGIDDSILSIIFGESLVEDAEDRANTSNPSPDDRDEDCQLRTQGTKWEDRLLQRIARELGTLVHHISEHPGAFSSYLEAKNQVPEYAGISNKVIAQPSISDLSRAADPLRNLQAPPTPMFSPTLPFNLSTSHFFTNSHSAAVPMIPEDQQLERERDYWERELDVKMVFSFLRSRFSSSSLRPSSLRDREKPDAKVAPTAASASRAALIRDHHPLVARRNDLQRRRANQSHSMMLAARGRRGSSCKSSIRSVSGSNRNFWDLGGSVGATSGSGIGVGVWGEG